MLLKNLYQLWSPNCGTNSIRLLDESPRWLFSQQRYKEAEAIIVRSLKQNGKGHLIPAQGFSTEELGLSLKPEGSSQEDTRTASTSIADLFRTPRLRYRTLNICFNWYALRIPTEAAHKPNSTICKCGQVRKQSFLLRLGSEHWCPTRQPVSDALHLRNRGSACLLHCGPGHRPPRPAPDHQLLPGTRRARMHHGPFPAAMYTTVTYTYPNITWL